MDRSISNLIRLCKQDPENRLLRENLYTNFSRLGMKFSLDKIITNKKTFFNDIQKSLIEITNSELYKDKKKGPYGYFFDKAPSCYSGSGGMPEKLNSWPMHIGSYKDSKFFMQCYSGSYSSVLKLQMNFGDIVENVREDFKSCWPFSRDGRAWFKMEIIHNSLSANEPRISWFIEKGVTAKDLSKFEGSNISPLKKMFLKGIHFMHYINSEKSGTLCNSTRRNIFWTAASILDFLYNHKIIDYTETLEKIPPGKKHWQWKAESISYDDVVDSEEQNIEETYLCDSQWEKPTPEEFEILKSFGFLFDFHYRKSRGVELCHINPVGFNGKPLVDISDLDCECTDNPSFSSEIWHSCNPRILIKRKYIKRLLEMNCVHNLYKEC